MRVFLTAALVSLLTALLITGLSPVRSLDEQLIRLQTRELMPEYADEMMAEPAELQALLLVYAQDPILLAKARLALLRYPELARPVLLAFGENASFQVVLRRYGEDVVLPIQYFLTNEVLTLELMHGMNETARAVMNAMRNWRDDQTVEKDVQSGLSSEDRGWYAIQFLEREGYDFLGQFVLSPAGEVSWVQTERVLEAINQFFAGGLKGLETKLRREETVGVGDVAWAAVDIAVGVGAFKVLRMGRAGAAGGSLTLSQRSAVVGAGLWRGTVIGARIVKYGAPAILAYMAVRHPSLIHSLLAGAAEKIGLPTTLVQVVGWTLILLPVFLVLRFLLAPLAWLAGALTGFLKWLNRVWAGKRPAYSSRTVIS